ncbi:MAG: hypothetical protein IPJ77_02520 [Planctomycetes bacterium]|nr:hypothetical protein [Planctomycetota bacterium]
MLQLAGIDVEAVSTGGVETCIDLPGFQLAFDLGRGPDFAVARELVAFTHAHVDHLSGVVWHCATRALRGMRPPRYVIGRENEAAFRDLFDVWRRLDRSQFPHELVVIGPGDELALQGGRFLRPFFAPHRAPCQGYAVWSRRSKLRAEHRALPHEEIARLRAAGRADLFEVLEVPEVAFCGDTLIDVVEREEVVRKARLLILEVTFLDERVSVEKARASGHVHLKELAARADLFENEAILLTHFSPRYTREEILIALDRGLPPRLRERATPLLNGRG